MFHRPFLMEVDPVEANQCMTPFYPSFDPLVDDDAATILSSARETTKTSKIRLLPLLHPPRSSSSLHSNERLHSHQRPSPAHPLAFSYSLHIVFAPPASSTSRLVWIATME